MIAAQTQQDLCRPARQRGIQRADHRARARSAGADAAAAHRGDPDRRRLRRAARRRRAAARRRARCRDPREHPDLGQSRAAGRQLGSGAASGIRTTTLLRAASTSSACTRTWHGLPAGAVVLLHACCHNPTGADLSAGSMAQRRRAGRKARAGTLRRSRVPGSGHRSRGRRRRGAPDRGAGPRDAARDLLLEELRPVSRARRRAGRARARCGRGGRVATHQARTARRMYSMPPDHGAAVVARVLGDPQLRASWAEELGAMTARINSLRELLAKSLAACRPDRDFSWLDAPSRHVLAAAPARGRTAGAARASPRLCAHRRPRQRRGDQRRQCRAGRGRDWQALSEPESPQTLRPPGAD